MKPASQSRSKSTGRPTGRPPKDRVPCDECIVRASHDKVASADLDLCQNCIAILHAARQKKSPERKRTAIARRHSQGSAPRSFVLAETSHAVPTFESSHESAFTLCERQTLPLLAGYFEYTMWHDMVLRACRERPAVRQALESIGSTHDQSLRGLLATDDMQHPRSGVGFEKCNQDIMDLLQPTGGPSAPDLQMMTIVCILFTLLDVLQGRGEAALLNAAQANSLLRHHVAQSDCEFQTLQCLQDPLRHAFIPDQMKSSCEENDIGRGPQDPSATSNVTQTGDIISFEQ